jgi:hypothetical protein
MEKLDGKALTLLQSKGSGFRTKNHHRFLSEAFQCTRTTGDPVEALALLAALPRAGYAGRGSGGQEEIKALNDIGLWLESRLNHEPSASADRIALELAWMRRISRIKEAEPNRYDGAAPANAQQAPAHGHGGHQAHGTSARTELRFGSKIEAIRQRREKARLSAARTAPKANAPAPPPRSAPAVPTRLPEVFAAEFVDLAAARKARKDAREREKRQKTPQGPRFLPIQPANPSLRPVAAGLVCSTHLDGFKRYFDAVAENAGVSRPFYVRGIEERDGQRLAREILLAPPVESVEQ